MKTTAKNYVVVSNPGTDKQAIEFEFWGPKSAYECADRMNVEEGVDIYDTMKRLDDGTLTSDF